EADYQRFNLAVFFRPRTAYVPPQPVVQSQIRLYSPAILREQTDIPRAPVRGVALALRIIGWGADQKVGKIYSRFGAVEGEVAVRPAVVFGQLVITELTANSQSM